MLLNCKHALIPSRDTSLYPLHSPLLNVHCCVGREDRQFAETGWLCKPLKSITFVDVYGSTVTPTTAQLIKAASNSTLTCTSWECPNLCLFVIDRWWGSRSSSVHLLGKLCQHAGLKGATSNCRICRRLASHSQDPCSECSQGCY